MSKTWGQTPKRSIIGKLFMKIFYVSIIVVLFGGCILFRHNYDPGAPLDKRVSWFETLIKAMEKEGRHYSPLVLAMDYNDYPAFEYFLKHGANINDVDCDGFAPITAVVIKNDIKLTKRLLKMGANPALPPENPLSWACSYRGNSEIAKLLLRYNSRINEKPGIYSPLMAGIRNIQIVKLLIQRGADVNAYSSGGSVLFYAMPDNILKISPSETEQILDLLIKNGADINYVFKGGFGAGETILSKAVFCNASPKIIEFLISRGADINYVFVGEGRDTLLDRAIFLREPPDLILLLRKHGAKTVNELVKEGKLPPDPSDDED